MRIKIIISVFLTFFIGCNCQEDKGVNSDNKQEMIKEFIIDNDVNMYKNTDGGEIKTKINFLESIIVLSNEVTSGGRVKIQLSNGEEGWIQEKYTSIIPKNWEKLNFHDKYYCFIPPNQKFDHKQDISQNSNVEFYESKNRKYNIMMIVSHEISYEDQCKSENDNIKYEINNQNSENLNWNKEIVLNNYKINYVITTFGTGESGMYFNESLYYIKDQESNQKKYYGLTIGIGSADKNDLLIYRKMLFSVLKSLQ